MRMVPSRSSLALVFPSREFALARATLSRCQADPLLFLITKRVGEPAILSNDSYSLLFSLMSKETAQHPLLNTLTCWWPSRFLGETLRRRRFWQREQELCHLRGTIQLGPMPL